VDIGNLIKHIMSRNVKPGFGLNGNDKNLVKSISFYQHRGHTIIILYFDIVRFREVEQISGSKTAGKILSLMREKLEQEIPRLLAGFRVLAIRNLWGDDFIAVISSADKPDIKKLQEMTLISRMKMKELLDRETRKLSGHPLELHVGFASVSGNKALKLESRIYSAIREAQSVAKGTLDLKIARLLPEFKELIEKEKLGVVYQPIVSLHTGTIMGWEALVRGPENGPFRSPGVIFDLAEKTGLLYAVEKLCRKQAIKNIGQLGPGQKLFLNIHPRTISDPGFVSGETLTFIKKAGFQPENVVFEITERHHIHDYVLFNETLQHYRKQGYLVAIDDMGAGFSSLQSIAEINPDYLKIDMSLVKDINASRVKKALLETFTAFGEKMGCMIIAEGIETRPELETLMNLGVHYGQGFYLARPAFPKPLVESSVAREMSQVQHEQPERTWGYSVMAKNIMEVAVRVEKDTPVKKIKQLLDANEPISGVVIVDKEDRPLGLLMRYHLDNLLGSQYGIPLYFHRPVSEVMDTLPLTVTEETPIEHVSQIAMNRERKKLYDSVIVTRDGRLSGIISVQRLLDTLTRVRVEIAKGANPLTGLPGNVAIEQRFSQICRQDLNCAMIYIDLDNFKSYNDRYGFEKGDEVILFTARLLQSVLKKYGSKNAFVGHIGGDDFVLFVDYESAEFICRKIVRYFDRLIPGFYNEEDRKRKKIRGYSRDGELACFPIISISLAIVKCSSECRDFKDFSRKASQLKRYAKSIQGSVFVKDRREAN